jgi:hypothetical protein
MSSQISSEDFNPKDDDKVSLYFNFHQMLLYFYSRRTTLTLNPTLSVTLTHKNGKKPLSIDQTEKVSPQIVSEDNKSKDITEVSLILLFVTRIS